MSNDKITNPEECPIKYRRITPTFEVVEVENENETGLKSAESRKINAVIYLKDNADRCLHFKPSYVLIFGGKHVRFYFRNSLALSAKYMSVLE